MAVKRTGGPAALIAQLLEPRQGGLRAVEGQRRVLQKVLLSNVGRVLGKIDELRAMRQL